VVKIYVSANPPDLLSPWHKAGVELATGSGVVIAKSRVLTNAHVVEDAVSIELKRSNSGQRHVAEVAYHRAIKIHCVGVQLHQQRTKDVPPVPTCECRLFAI